MRVNRLQGLFVIIRRILLLLLVASPGWAAAAVPTKCDVNGDGVIDSRDINLILAARNTQASGANDPRDYDGNGVINVLDARACQLRCTLAGCAIPATNHPPVANAGPDQTVFVNDTVHLNGTGSTDVDGDPLTYSWTLTGKPAGSAAALTNANTATPTFVVDVHGTYTARLVVNDSKVDSAPDDVVITTGNSRPVANPKASCASLPNTDCSAPIGSAIGLNGSASTDVDGDAITYQWSIVGRPQGSTAALTSPTGVTSGFTTDAPGDFTIQLIVNDGTVDSLAKQIKITSTNAKPTAVATIAPVSIPNVPQLMQLDGTGSTDPENQPLTYKWSLIAKPGTSAATLSNANAANPTFTADVLGTYTAQLIVNDGFLDSDPVTVTASTSNQAPIANAGPDQTVTVGSTAQLTSAGSHDPEGANLGYFWSFSLKPSGSATDFNNANAQNPTFVADVPGTYVVQLIVNDGSLNSAPDTVQITAVQAALSISKSHTGNFRQGQTGATYTISVSNAANAVATSGTVSVVDTLPSGLTASALAGTGWSCTLGTLTCTRSDALAGGASYPAITLTVDVAGNAATSVTNSASVSGGNSPSANANDATTVLPAADLAIVKSHTGDFTQSQTGGTYTITVSNPGAGPTVGTVTVTDTLPGGLTATGLSGTGWSCSTGTMTCTRSDALAAGASYPSITVTVNVAANASASITNTATVSGGGELNTANDTATDPTTVTAAAATLTITKTHAGNFVQGQTGATYTITVTNSASGGASSGTVTVTDTLPTGLTATGLSGTGWACTLATLTCTRSDALNAGASYPAITLKVTVASDAPANVSNSAAVSGGGMSGSVTANDPTVIGSYGTLGIAPNPKTIEAIDTATMTLSLSSPAPSGGLTVDLSSSDTTIATVPATATITAGQTSTTFTLTSLAKTGDVTLTASATGATTGTATVHVINRGASLLLANQFLGVSQTINARITLTRPAPTGGVTFDVASSNTNFATVSAAQVNIPAGQTQGSFTVTGVAAGSGNITASSNGYSPQTAGFTVTSNRVDFSSRTNYSNQFIVGKDLQYPNYINTNTSAPNGGLQITITSDNSSLLVSSSASAQGSASTTLTIQAGQTQAGPFYIQSLASTGTGTLTLSVATSPNPGYAPADPMTVTLVPSGYELYCNGCSHDGQKYTLSTTTQASPVLMYVQAWSLDPSRTDYNRAQTGYIRGGITQSIPLTLTDSSLGAFTDYPSQTAITAVPMASNEYYHYFYFDPNNNSGGGSGTIGYTKPTGAGTPTYNSLPYDQTILVTVAATPVTFSSPTNYNSLFIVGQDLQYPNYINLGGPAPAGGLQVRVSSNNTNVHLSLSATADGSDHVDLTVPQGQTQAGPFYVQSLANSGTATLTLTILTSPNPGFAGSSMTVTMAPSGYELYCNGCSHDGQKYTLSTTTQASPVLMYVVAWSLDPSRTDYNRAQSGYIRGGITQSIPLTLTDSSLGAFTDYPSQTAITAVPMASNENYHYFYFDPNNNGAGGSGTIGYTKPTGAGTPTYNSLPYDQTIPVTVAATPVTFSSPTNYNSLFIVGQDLQYPNYINLGGPAPAGGLQVRVSSNNSNVHLSLSATADGSDHIDLTIPAGQTQAGPFYVQSLANSGTATLTVSILTSPNPGFASSTMTVTMVPSGYELYCNGTGCSHDGQKYTLSTTTQASPVLMYVQAWSLDPSRTDYNRAQTGYIRGGITQSIPLTLTNSSLGAFSDYPSQTAISAVPMASNENYHYFYFDPNNSAGSGGSGAIGYTKPTGAGTPTYNSLPYDQTIPVSETTTPITFNTVNNYANQYAVGKDLQETNYINLNGPAPAGGLQVRVTSNSTDVHLSTSPTADGADHVDLTIAEGSTQGGPFYIQALANSGTATLTTSVDTSPNPGFDGTSMTVTLVPSGFELICAGGGCGFANNAYTLTTPASGGNVPMYIQAMALDPVRTDYNRIANQNVRGGFNETISLTLDQPIGRFLDYPSATTVVNSVTIPSGQYYNYFYFDPQSTGTGTIGYVQPAGSTVPRSSNADYLQTIFTTLQ